MSVNNELNKLPKPLAKQLEKWFLEKIYKTDKLLKNDKFNYIPYVKRRDVIWVDFGINIGQELNNSHPAIVLYACDSSGTIIVVPLTSKENESEFVINIGQITGMDNNFSHAKVDQLKSISKARIQIKKNPENGKYYNNYDKVNCMFNNPKVTGVQMQKIDDLIMQFKDKSAK
jgi:mRNA-degrading endonuclease toxin of MazEF toxin-antitoxin module